MGRKIIDDLYRTLKFSLNEINNEEHCLTFYIKKYIDKLKLNLLFTEPKGNLQEDFLVNTKKYHVFAPMGRFQLESIYLYNSWDDGGK